MFLTVKEGSDRTGLKRVQTLTLLVPTPYPV